MYNLASSVLPSSRSSDYQPQTESSSSGKAIFFSLPCFLMCPSFLSNFIEICIKQQSTPAF